MNIFVHFPEQDFSGSAEKTVLPGGMSLDIWYARLNGKRLFSSKTAIFEQPA